MLRARQANAPRARELVQVVDQHEVGVVQEQEDRHLSVALVGRRANWPMRYWKSSLAQGTPKETGESSGSMLKSITRHPLEH